MRWLSIVGYTFKARTYCPKCIIRMVSFRGDPSVPSADPSGVEARLDLLASRMGIDREDEHTYDSGQFPKVVLLDMTETDDRCDSCGETLGGS